MDEARSQADYGHLPTLQTSRSPSARVELASIAEYQEWLSQSLPKRTRIGNETVYNLESQLPHIPEHLHLPVPPPPPEALGMHTNETSAQAAKRKCVPWKPKENKTVLKMKERGCSWKEILNALPHRILGAIQVQYSTKLKKWPQWK